MVYLLMMSEVVGISGANSNLGKLLSAHLKESNVRVLEFSSNPKLNQKTFDINGKVDYEGIAQCRYLIHCARLLNPNREEIVKELAILEKIKQFGTMIINISSVSAFLDNRNNYGDYKRTIYDWARRHKQVNLVPGLIFGEEFRGQIHKMSLLLEVFPIKPRLSGDSEIYLTPLNQIISTIDNLLIESSHQEKILICKNPITTNQLLSDISHHPLITLNLNRKMVLSVLKLIPNNRYFTSDSFLGFTGSYSELKNKSAQLQTSLVQGEWNRYCSGLKLKRYT
jgi:hypothetical protein